MKTLSIVLVLGIAICWTKCNRTTTTEQPNEPPKTTINISAEIDSAMIKSNNAFALEIFKELNSATKNVSFSPFSISTAMAMTYAGAREESEKQISKVLHFNKDQQNFHPAYSALLEYIKGLNRKDSLELHTANALYAQNDYPFSEDYFNLIRTNYGAEAQNLDFKNETEKSRLVINKWVKEQTRDKIEELLKPGILGDLTRLVLVNAIYFLGKWENAFNPDETMPLSFIINQEQSVNAEFMVREGKVNIYENEDLQVLELPYAGKDMSMIIYLPRTKENRTELISEFSMDKISLWNTKMSNKEMKIYIPKFKISAEFELSEILKNMGMPHPFSLQADLSGMTGRRDLMIDKVVHQACIEVNEKGTEAAAATAVVIREKSAKITPEFRADHPFLFIIKENKYDNILFAGRLNNPAQ